MKALFSALFLLVSFIRLSAQQEHFVFIQESNKQPFYVRVGEESQSSSASGHIILAPIKDSVYSFFIGFPKARYAEQPFTIPVRRDVGFELKRVEGVWQLIDLQSQQVIRPNINNARDTGGVRRDDAYSKLMADVVDDTSVLYAEILDTVQVVDSVVIAAAAAAPQAVDSGQRQQAPVQVAKDSPKVATVTDSVTTKPGDQAGV